MEFLRFFRAVSSTINSVPCGYVVAAVLFAAFAASSVAEDVAKPEGDPKNVIVAAYNVRNYLLMDRWKDGERQKFAPKPEDEVKAVVEVLAEIGADIVAVVEVGRQSQLDDLCARLKAAGHDYPHTELVESLGDEVRHVALISKFPIVARNSQTALGYELNGVQEYMSRGILDVTVEINPDYKLRVLGVHLKSKRPVPQGEAIIRRNEAHLLREHIDAILEEDPNVNLLVTGDLNDTKNEPAIKEVVGRRGSYHYMADLWLEDAFGDRWTHYWKTADLYSRIDYMLVNRALWPEVLRKESYVHRSPAGRIASDHRAVVTVIKPVNVEPRPLREKRGD